MWADGSEDLAPFLYCWLFCVLTRRYHLQVYLELIGRGGSGKSIFMQLCIQLVGKENTASTELKQLETNRFEAAKLYDKLLTIISDSEQHRGEVAKLKQITGGDPIRHEQKHKQEAEAFIYRGLVMVATNEAIQSKDYTSGVSRRRKPLSFMRKVTEAEINKYENEVGGIHAVFEREMPGLVNKLLALDPADAERTIRNPAQALADNALQIEIDCNPILGWADDYLVLCARGQESNIGDKKQSPDEKLYPSFVHWCEGQGREPLSESRFSNLLVDQLNDKGIDTKKDRAGKGRFLHNLKLRRHSNDSTHTLLSKKPFSAEYKGGA